MSTSKLRTLRLLLLVVWITIGSCSSEETKEAVEKTSESQSRESTSLDESPEPVGNSEKPKQEKLVVAYVPDYPSKIVHPGMLANTSHLIMFYASWCQHSDAALPHFKDTLQSVMDMNITQLHLGKIEVTQNKDAVKNFRIRSTPTFLMYHQGARYVYEGEVTSQGLLDFLQRVLAINLTEVSLTRELAEMRRNHPVVFLLVHDGERDPDWHHAFSIVARDKGLAAKYIFTTKADLVQDYNVTKFPTLLVLKDGSVYKFSDSMTTHNVAKWVTRERYPAFPRVNEETFRPFTNLALGRRLAVLLVHEDTSQQRITEKRLIDTVRKVAESRKAFPQFQFVQLTSVSLTERMIQSTVPRVPYFFVYDPLTGQHYLFQTEEEGGKGGTTEAAIKDFLNDVKQGKVEPLGGRHTFGAMFYSWWSRLYNTYQAMVTYRPWLSLVAVFSLFSVIIFYTLSHFRQSSRSHRTAARRGKNNKKTRAAAIAAAAKDKKQRQRQPAAADQHTNGDVRRRQHTREKEGEEVDEEEQEEALNRDSDSHSSSDNDSKHKHSS